MISPSTKEINNLNKSTFTKDYLSENSYYTKFGKQTISVKKEIEKAIKEKFNQTSDILDNFTWKEKSENDLMYAMLYKKFTFEVAFNQLDNSTFNSEDIYERTNEYIGA